MNRHDRHADLGPLDPGRDDPGYWPRFHAAVMVRALPALARRRRGEPVTVSDIVNSWSRLLVPGAVAAALAAGLVLVDEVEPEPVPQTAVESTGPETGPPAPEELFLITEDGETIMPAFFIADRAPDRAEVLLAIEGF